jgi:tetratricopeptide (TPR) repeat protein
MSSRIRLATFVAALAALALVACQTPRQIREAQSAFNEAARAENADRVASTDSGSMLLASESAASSYRVALGLVQRELDEHEAELREDGLLGTALMLKALALWRIADLDGDPSSSRELDAAVSELQERAAANEPGVVLGPRDAALLVALPGLRDHDLGLRQAEYARAKGYFESALAVYEKALADPSLPANHSLRTYLQLSELATLRAWKDAAFTNEELPTQERDAVEKSLLERSKCVAEQLEPAARHDETLARLVQWYARGIGFSWPSEEARCSNRSTP